MPPAPLVSVVMPTFRPDPGHLGAAIDSILRQDLPDLELLVVDGGSPRPILDLVSGRAEQDGRVRLVGRPGAGLVDSLNEGFRLARAKAVARMDADDVSHPHRLREQARFLEDHPEIGAVGSWVRDIDVEGRPVREHRMRTAPSLCHWTLFFGSCAVHPALMLRRDAFQAVGGYRNERPFAEDYDLLARLSWTTRIANLPAVLLDRRIWPSNIGNSHQEERSAVHARIMLEQTHRMGLTDVVPETIGALRACMLDRVPSKRAHIEAAVDLVRRLEHAFVAETQVTRQERRHIRRHAALTISNTAKAMAGHSRVASARILLRAMRLSPGLLFRPGRLQAGLRTLAGRRRSGWAPRTAGS